MASGVSTRPKYAESGAEAATDIDESSRVFDALSDRGHDEAQVGMYTALQDVSEDIEMLARHCQQEVVAFRSSASSSSLSVVNLVYSGSATEGWGRMGILEDDFSIHGNRGSDVDFLMVHKTVKIIKHTQVDVLTAAKRLLTSGIIQKSLTGARLAFNALFVHVDNFFAYFHSDSQTMTSNASFTPEHYSCAAWDIWPGFAFLQSDGGGFWAFDRNLEKPDEEWSDGPSMKSVCQHGDGDFVPAVRCNSWPQQAEEWRTRRNLSGWPTNELKLSCLNSPIYMVAKCPDSLFINDFISAILHLSRTPVPELAMEFLTKLFKNLVTVLSWRYSFSSIEKLLIRSFDDLHGKCFVLLKLIFKRRLKLSISSVKSYHAKTLIFWLMEEDRAFVEMSHKSQLFGAVYKCLEKLKTFIIAGHFPNYFIPNMNILIAQREDVQPILTSIDNVLRMLSRKDNSLLKSVYLQKRVEKAMYFKHMISNERFIESFVLKLAMRMTTDNQPTVIFDQVMQFLNVNAIPGYELLCDIVRATTSLCYMTIGLQQKQKSIIRLRFEAANEILLSMGTSCCSLSRALRMLLRHHTRFVDLADLDSTESVNISDDHDGNLTRNFSVSEFLHLRSPTERRDIAVQQLKERDIYDVYPFVCYVSEALPKPAQFWVAETCTTAMNNKFACIPSYYIFAYLHLLEKGVDDLAAFLAQFPFYPPWDTQHWRGYSLCGHACVHFGIYSLAASYFIQSAQCRPERNVMANSDLWMLAYCFMKLYKSNAEEAARNSEILLQLNDNLFDNEYDLMMYWKRFYRYEFAQDADSEVLNEKYSIIMKFMLQLIMLSAVKMSNNI